MDNKYDVKKERATAEVMLEERASSIDEARQRSQDYATNPSLNNPVEVAQPQFKLYKRRFSGVIGVIILSVVAGMNLPWFGPIANNSMYICSFAPTEKVYFVSVSTNSVIL